MSMPPRANAPQVEGSTAKHVNITTAPVFPGDAADGAAVVGASASARIEGLRHGWRVLGILSALMYYCNGDASLSSPLPVSAATGNPIANPERLGLIAASLVCPVAHLCQAGERATEEKRGP